MHIYNIADIYYVIDKTHGLITSNKNRTKAIEQALWKHLIYRV